MVAIFRICLDEYGIILGFVGLMQCRTPDIWDNSCLLQSAAPTIQSPLGREEYCRKFWQVKGQQYPQGGIHLAYLRCFLTYHFLNTLVTTEIATDSKGYV